MPVEMRSSRDLTQRRRGAEKPVADSSAPLRLCVRYSEEVFAPHRRSSLSVPGRSVLLVLLALALTQAALAREPRVLVVLIGGMDSDPTAEQLAGTAERGRGNSGMYQLQGDLRSAGLDTEYFNWNGTRAGRIAEKKPPRTAMIRDVIRDRLESHAQDRVCIVGNSWGGHTAYEVCRELYECEQPLRVESLVLLDPSSAGRSLKKPTELPVNIGRAVNYYTRNAFVWGKLKSPRLINVDLGDSGSGFLEKGGPEYNAIFSFPAHVSAEWDGRIHADIQRRVLDARP